jgi:hypothetical protein
LCSSIFGTPLKTHSHENGIDVRFSCGGLLQPRASM